jgi:hypothetical protein
LNGHEFMVLTLVEQEVIGHNLNQRMRREAVQGELLGELNQGLPHHTAESSPATMTFGDSTADSELDDVDEEATNVSISPQAETTLFPSRVPEESQLQYNHMPNGRVESSRESVLQRLSEALLQRSLTKVRFSMMAHSIGLVAALTPVTDFPYSDRPLPTWLDAC